MSGNDQQPPYGSQPPYGPPPPHGPPPPSSLPPNPDPHAVPQVEGAPPSHSPANPYAPPPEYGPGPVRPPAGYGPPAVMVPPGWEYASYGRRLAAFVLDMVFLFLCLMPVGMVCGAVLAVAADDNEPPVWAVLLTVVSVLAAIFVWLRAYVWQTGTRGQSWGRRVVGIYVLSTNGLVPIGGGAGILRYLVMRLISGVTCGIGGILDFLWPLWDPQHQTLHDKVVSSVVVRRPA